MNTLQGLQPRQVFRFALVALAVRGAWFLVDSRPRFFLGDSESYLATAMGGWIPPDRSWFYGLAVNAVLRMTHRLAAVIAMQATLTALACVFMAALLRILGVRSWIAWAALVLYGADPLAHYYDRSLLTDAPAAAFIWIGIALSAAGLARGGHSLWVSAVPFLWLTILLRTALLPMVVAPSLIGIAVGLWRNLSKENTPN